MFAGVAASSMPTVHQFFVRKNFSFLPWKLSFWSSSSRFLSRLRGSNREKASCDSATFTDPTVRGWASSEAYRLEDVEKEGPKDKTAASVQTEDSQIHLTRDVFVTREAIV